MANHTQHANQPAANRETHEALLQLAIDRLTCLSDIIAPRLERFMGYYRNPARPLTEFLPTSANASLPLRPYRLYQEAGLPARITGFRVSPDGEAQSNGSAPLELRRKEVVIENDIAWRLNTLVDFVAGQMPAITSTARDPETRRTLTTIVNAWLQRGGGADLFANLTLLAAVHGTAYLELDPQPSLLARLDAPNTMAATAADAQEQAGAADSGRESGDGGSGGSGGGGGGDDSGADSRVARSDMMSMEEFPAVATDALRAAVDAIRFKTASAARICPLVVAPSGSPIAFAVLHRTEDGDEPTPRSFVSRLKAWLAGDRAQLIASDGLTRFSFDLIEPGRWRRFVRGEMVAQGTNGLNFLPYWPLTNAYDPAVESSHLMGATRRVPIGMSDVEPLMPLQDELNTRLSDRAYRITMQSARIYLGKGIADFETRPVGPGQMWATDNPEASIEEFGGDASCAGEESHITEIREALDKVSGVTPVAAGLLRGKVGNLTSAVALRVTLIALLAKARRRRAAITALLQTVVAQALQVLDRAGLMRTAPEDRGIDINWPSALPENELDRLQQAQLKISLGVPKRTVLSELGYEEAVSE